MHEIYRCIATAISHTNCPVPQLLIQMYLNAYSDVYDGCVVFFLIL